VILVVIDTLRADHVGAYGYQRNTTPVLDALARDNLLYTRGAVHGAVAMALK
jgi:arylsulfatase